MGTSAFPPTSTDGMTDGDGHRDGHPCERGYRRKGNEPEDSKRDQPEPWEREKDDHSHEHDRYPREKYLSMILPPELE